MWFARVKCATVKLEDFRLMHPYFLRTSALATQDYTMFDFYMTASINDPVWEEIEPNGKVKCGDFVIARYKNIDSAVLTHNADSDTDDGSEADEKVGMERREAGPSLRAQLNGLVAKRPAGGPLEEENTRLTKVAKRNESQGGEAVGIHLVKRHIHVISEITVHYWVQFPSGHYHGPRIPVVC